MDPSMYPYPMPEEIPPPTLRKRYYDPLVTGSVIVLFLTNISMYFATASVAFSTGTGPIFRMLIVAFTSIAVCLLIYGTLRLSMRNDVHWSLPASGWFLLVSMVLSMPVLDFSAYYWYAIPFTLFPTLILYAHWYRDRRRTSGDL